MELANGSLLKEKLARLPREPGCYLMKDARGSIIYVGKAKSLKSRVANYFGAEARLAWKTRDLVREICDFEVMITSTEVEALLLERTLIKHHQPRFNILLRDDKEYPWLRVDLKEPWPRLTKVRRRKDDGAIYLGPFGSAGQLKILLDATYRIFPLIRCSPHEFQAAKRPCNYYHMGMCLGPCTLPVERSTYVGMVEDAVQFLRGRNKDLVRALREKMQKAADADNFELAALLRDQLKAFAVVTEKQAVVIEGVTDADAIGMDTSDGRVAFSVLMVREGFLVSNDAFVTEAGAGDDGNALVQFLLQFYDGRSLPQTLFLPLAPEDLEELRLALLSGHPEMTRLSLTVPERGQRHDLVEMAIKNAAYRLDELQRLGEKRRAELEVLKERLRLQRFPQRMECIDISNTQGVGIVASNVCFIAGKPAKEFYRHYKVESIVNAPDDFGSIREVVRRRLERARRDGDLPDLLVIDGGKGQLSAAMDAQAEFPELRFDLVSLAKSKVDKRDKARSFVARGIAERSYERVFKPGEELPTPLTPGTPEFRLMTQIRDEAHRFAITHHRKLRGKLSLGSELTEIPGIGPALRQRLLTQLGGIEGLRRASLDELRSVKGLRESAAVALYAQLRGNEDEAEQTDEATAQADREQKGEQD